MAIHHAIIGKTHYFNGPCSIANCNKLPEGITIHKYRNKSMRKSSCFFKLNHLRSPISQGFQTTFCQERGSPLPLCLTPKDAIFGVATLCLEYRVNPKPLPSWSRKSQVFGSMRTLQLHQNGRVSRRNLVSNACWVIRSARARAEDSQAQCPKRARADPQWIYLTMSNSIYIYEGFQK